MEYDYHAAAGHVAQSVLEVKNRLQEIWPIRVSDRDALSTGLCCCMTNTGDALELMLNSRLSSLVCSNIERISMNNAEFVLIIKHFSTRLVDGNSLIRNKWFCDRRDKMEKALQCTVAENTCATAWQRPATQLAVVLALQCSQSPIAVLDSIFGSVVRSDVRRVDDVHFECLDETPDPYSFVSALEIVSTSLL
jgi:hypothetical protein